MRFGDSACTLDEQNMAKKVALNSKTSFKSSCLIKLPSRSEESKDFNARSTRFTEALPIETPTIIHQSINFLLSNVTLARCLRISFWVELNEASWRRLNYTFPTYHQIFWRRRKLKNRKRWNGMTARNKDFCVVIGNKKELRITFIFRFIMLYFFSRSVFGIKQISFSDFFN
jgi:hypothetical protein